MTQLIIRHEHWRSLHAPKDYNLAELMKTNWLINGRATVKKVVNRCVLCKKREARPVSQQMSPLPAYRLERPKYPFNTSALKVAGPFYIKFGRETTKKYILLITCAVTRAVHLKKLKDLSSDEVLLALEQFIARRCVPSKIFSANGTNFVGAYNELKNLWDELTGQKAV
jgi:hypothetical protein